MAERVEQGREVLAEIEASLVDPQTSPGTWAVEHINRCDPDNMRDVIAYVRALETKVAAGNGLNDLIEAAQDHIRRFLEPAERSVETQKQLVDTLIRHFDGPEQRRAQHAWRTGGDGLDRIGVAEAKASSAESRVRDEGKAEGRREAFKEAAEWLEGRAAGIRSNIASMKALGPDSDPPLSEGGVRENETQIACLDRVHASLGQDAIYFRSLSQDTGEKE